MLLLIGRLIEPANPPAWGVFTPKSYDREIERVFLAAANGYLLATGVLFILATVALFGLRNAPLFRRLLLSVVVGAACWLTLLAMGAWPKVR